MSSIPIDSPDFTAGPQIGSGNPLTKFSTPLGPGATYHFGPIYIGTASSIQMLMFESAVETYWTVNFLYDNNVAHQTGFGYQFSVVGTTNVINQPVSSQWVDIVAFNPGAVGTTAEVSLSLLGPGVPQFGVMAPAVWAEWFQAAVANTSYTVNGALVIPGRAHLTCLMTVANMMMRAYTRGPGVWTQIGQWQSTAVTQTFDIDLIIPPGDFQILLGAGTTAAGTYVGSLIMDGG